MGNDTRVKVVALVVLGTLLGTAMVCVTVVSVTTDRSMVWDMRFLAGAIVIIAVLGGLSVWWANGRGRNGE